MLGPTKNRLLLLEDLRVTKPASKLATIDLLAAHEESITEMGAHGNEGA
jgi:hypothetical protein